MFIQKERYFMNKMSSHFRIASRKALNLPIDDKEYTVSLTKYIPVNNNIIVHISSVTEEVLTNTIVEYNEDDDFMDVVYNFVEAKEFKNVTSFSFIIEFKTDDVILKVCACINEEGSSENKTEEFIFAADEIIRYWMICNTVNIISKARTCKSIDEIIWRPIDYGMITFLK